MEHVFDSECGSRTARVVHRHDGASWILYVNERCDRSLHYTGRRYFGDNWRGAGWSLDDAIAAAERWCAGGEMPAVSP